MEIIAITSNLLHYVLAVVGVVLCVVLFRHRRQCGWLLVGTVFLQPLVLLVMRACRGRPLLTYKTQALGSDGLLHIHYQWDFPICYALAVVGLILLIREARRGPPA